MNGEMFPPQEQEQKGFFKKQGPDPAINDMVNQVRDVSRRLRIIEERYSGLRKNVQVNEQNMLNEGRKTSSEIKAVNSDISEMKRILIEVKDEMRMIISEVRESVKKEELKVLEKYVSLWEPVNFVTTAEVEKIVANYLEKTGKK